MKIIHIWLTGTKKSMSAEETLFQQYFLSTAMGALKTLSPSQSLTHFKTKNYRHLKMCSTSTCQNREAGSTVTNAAFKMQFGKSTPSDNIYPERKRARTF